MDIWAALTILGLSTPFIWLWGVVKYPQAPNPEWRARASLVGLAAPVLSFALWLVGLLLAWRHRVARLHIGPDDTSNNNNRGCLDSFGGILGWNRGSPKTKSPSSFRNPWRILCAATLASLNSFKSWDLLPGAEASSPPQIPGSRNPGIVATVSKISRRPFSPYGVVRHSLTPHLVACPLATSRLVSGP